MSHKILIADDEPLFRQTTGELLETAGYTCTCVSDAREALVALRDRPFDLILSDLNMPGNERLELLTEGRQIAPSTPLIVITGVPSLPTAIESIRLGIADYLLKPVKFQDLLNSIQRVLANRGTCEKQSFIVVDRTLEEVPRYPGIIGESQCMIEVYDVIERLANSEVNVLITGESGTGKEIVAKTIHVNSSRSAHPFQVIDCTAIPETLFESVLFGHVKGAFTGAVKDQEGLISQADRGTLFLDEIGELPKSQQAKLLRVIQEQTFYPVGGITAQKLNTRFLCATNRDLETEVNLGNFRRDLFYRLAVVHVALPPLRDRGQDIELLTHYFERQLQGKVGTNKYFSKAALEGLHSYSWPGNVRELRNVVENCLALSREECIDLPQLPKSLLAEISAAHPNTDSGQTSRTETINEAERQYFIDLLRRHCGNVTQAATEAQLSRQGLHKLLRKHNINAANYRV